MLDIVDIFDIFDISPRAPARPPSFTKSLRFTVGRVTF
jgi:hypothetical protein